MISSWEGNFVFPSLQVGKTNVVVETWFDKHVVECDRINTVLPIGDDVLYRRRGMD